MSPDSSSPVDLSWRPETYFWPSGLEKQLLAKVKGAARRAALQRLIDEGRLVEIPDFLATAGLSEDERTAIGRIHPRFMGGEYLPDQEEDEIEIARIEINSTTGDVTSVYAYQDISTIRYRVVDEYGGETLRAPTERTSTQPLTLGELEVFFLGAWPFFEVLEMNFDTDTEQMLGFIQGDSQFYPDFDQLLRERVIEAYPESHQDKDTAASDDGRIALGDKDNRDPDPRQTDLPLVEGGEGAMSHRVAIFPAGYVDSADEPFVTGVRDFDGVDEALATANEYLGTPTPDEGRLPGRSVSLQNEHREDGSWLNLDASLQRDGSLRISGQDLGPVTKGISPDGEYEYFYTVAAEDVPALVVALGGQPGIDVLDLLEQRWSGDDSYSLGAAIRSSGVAYHFSSYP